ncbi:MAG: HAD family hydrolase [Candidatus Nanopelagicales bacterium]
MSVDAVIFDWGGTLTPWHDIDLVGLWSAYARSYEPSSDPRALAQRLADEEVGRWKRQQASSGADGTGALDHLFASVGIDITTRRHGVALAAYLAAWEPHTLADPDAIEVMSSLRARGIRVGVLSNTMWPRWHHEAVFSRDGLLPLIDAAVYSSEIPVAKPHADAFAAVCAALGVPASRSAFVGDRPWDDVHGAQQAGMRAILIPHSRLGDQAVDIEVLPEAVVARLGEVVAVIDSWRAP